MELPFLIFGVLICLSAFSQNFILTNNYSDIWDPSLSLIGLGNWLPFILFFYIISILTPSQKED